MTNNAITLYAHLFPSRAERVLWVLQELELDHALKRIDASKGELASASFRALNPAGKIPVLTHGDVVMTESVAICEYLAKLAPERGLLPTSAEEHYAYARLMHFVITEVEAYLWVSDQAGRLNAYYPWPSGTEAFALSLAEKNIAALRHLLADDDTGYACCGRFTVIDVMLTQITGWALGGRITVPDALIAHSKAMRLRPSCPENMRLR